MGREFRGVLLLATVLTGCFAVGIYGVDLLVPPPPSLPPQPIPPGTTFLDVPLASDWFDGGHFAEQITCLERILRKQVVLPDGALPFARQVENWNVSHTVSGKFQITKTIPLLGPPTPRDLLDRVTPDLGMGWTYDKPQDRIVLGFPWRQDDPRSDRELIDVLLHTPVPPAESILSKRDYWDTRRLDDNEVWRVAFDSLVSKPENFPNAWKIRFADDLLRNIIVPFPVDNLATVKMVDQSGIPHVVVLNQQAPFMLEEAGTVSYYVFDLNGRFEQGGFVGSGFGCDDASAFLDSTQKNLILRVFFKDTTRFDQSFILTPKGLIFQDVVNASNIPLSRFEYAGFHFNEPVFHLPD